MKQRTKSCLKLIKELGLDALLISNPVNITYLSSFKEPTGYLLLVKTGELIYFTNFLYWKAAAKIKSWKVLLSNPYLNIFGLVVAKVKELGLKEVGFEAKHIPFLEFKYLDDRFKRKGVFFSKTEDLVESLRMLKSKDELSLIKRSIKISEEAFEFIAEIFDPTMSEKDLSIEVEKFLRIKGDNQIAFSPIVACGRNTVFPHHLPTDRKIGDKIFLIDLGSKYYGYCADLTRMFFWGKMPLLFRKIYDIVRKAKDLSIKKVRAGIKVSAIDKVARDYIEKKGFGKYFGHGVGHGIGLSVHEPPFLGPNNDSILEENSVITLEPAIYFKDKFGVRLEDMILVKQGKGEVLNGNADR